MPYTATDFETQIAAIITAVDAEDKVACLKALVKARAIHDALTRARKKGDQGSDLEYREKTLADLEKTIKELFEAINEESTGGMTDVFIGRPDSLE